MLFEDGGAVYGLRDIRPIASVPNDTSEPPKICVFYAVFGLLLKCVEDSKLQGKKSSSVTEITQTCTTA